MGIASLDAAISGLRISQQQLDTISSNIANAGNEGYSRKILPQTSLVIEGRSAGVRGQPIMRSVDMNLQRDFWSQISSTDFHSVQESYLKRVSDFHGPPDSKFSISAEVSALQDSFAALADSPEDRFLMSTVVAQAQDSAEKISDFATYLSQLRNDTQNEIDDAVKRVNALLEEISQMNADVRFAGLSGTTSAEFADRRDKAIRELSGFFELTTFQRGDGVLVVQTAGGAELASDVNSTVNFNPIPLSAASTTAAPILLGDINTGQTIDITGAALGGKIGGLLALRDETFPKQLAQLDELAHKMALRFDAQGLRLFTDTAGNIPADTPPDTATNTPVEYVGFANSLRVNIDVINDNTLLRQGTYGGTVQDGSNEVIRRVLDFTFGDVEFQRLINNDAATSVDIRAAATGTTTLQDWLGLRAQSSLSGSTDLTAYNDVADIITAGGDSVFGPTAGAETDRFTIIFDDPDFGGGPYDIDVDLRAVTDSGGNAAQDLIAHITADADWAGALADYGATITVNASGALQFGSNSNVEIAAAGAEPLSTQGFAYLGLTPTTVQASDPYFDIQLGNSDPVRITINPADTEVELLAAINAIDGVVAQIDADGFLSVRPGNSFVNSDFGGDIFISGGPFTTNGASLAATAAGRTSIDDGVGIVSSLFGTYNTLAPGVFENISPIESIGHQSEINNGSGTFAGFRSVNLGANADTATEIVDARNLVDFAQKMLNDHTQDLVLAQSRKSDEDSLKGLLEQQYLDRSAVNIDEELGFLIMVQTSYAASARVVTAVGDLFDDLINSFR